MVIQACEHLSSLYLPSTNEIVAHDAAEPARAQLFQLISAASHLSVAFLIKLSWYSCIWKEALPRPMLRVRLRAQEKLANTEWQV